MESKDFAGKGLNLYWLTGYASGLYYTIKNFLLKKQYLHILFFLVLLDANAQVAVMSFDSATDTSGLYSRFGYKKQLPPGFEKQALIALSYFPELKGIAVNFNVEKDIVPLTTMPSFRSVFLSSSKRTYNITISSESNVILSPILLKNLGYNAQIGVLGHELSHVSDFQGYGFWKFVVHAIRYTLSPDYGDKFEYATDRICIDHGLGYQLLAWSRDVRQKLDVKLFMRDQKTDTERYMNPETIEKIITNHPLYRRR